MTDPLDPARFTMTPRQRHILALLEKRPLSQHEIRAYRIQDSGVTIVMALASLHAKGFIRMDRPKEAARAVAPHGEVETIYRYHITPAGLGVLGAKEAAHG